MGRVWSALLCVLLAWMPAAAQTVFEVLPQSSFGTFSGTVAFADGSTWQTTGPTFSATAQVLFPDLSSWSAAGLRFASTAGLTMPDTSVWTATGLTFSGPTTIRGPDGSTWTQTGLAFAPGKPASLANGSSAVPALNFSEQASMGLYRETTDDLRVILSGGILAARFFKPSASSGALSVPIGASTGQASVGGRVCSSTTAAATTGTSQQTLASCDLGANALAVDNMGVKVMAWATTAATANNKTLALTFGASTCATQTATTNNGTLFAEAVILRRGSSSQECAGKSHASSGAFVVTRATPAEATGGAITVAVKGTTPTASGDLTLQAFTVELIN